MCHHQLPSFTNLTRYNPTPTHTPPTTDQPDPQAGWFARMVATFCERLGEGFYHLHMLTDGLVNRVFRGVRQEVRGGGVRGSCGSGRVWQRVMRAATFSMSNSFIAAGLVLTHPPHPPTHPFIHALLTHSPRSHPQTLKKPTPDRCWP